MKKLAYFLIAFALLIVRLECSAQSAIKIYNAAELKGHSLVPVGGDYDGFSTKDLFDLCVEEGSKATQIKEIALALTGEKNISFLNKNENFRLIEDTTLAEGSYYNSAWDTSLEKIVFFLGKSKEHCSVYLYKGQVFYLEACANFIFTTRNNYSQNSDLPSRTAEGEKEPAVAVADPKLQDYKQPIANGSGINVTVYCNGCQQQQQQQVQEPYYSSPQPYYSYYGGGSPYYGVSYGVSYSTTPVYYNNHYYHHNNSGYYGRREQTRGTYYRYPRQSPPGGPNGAPGNGGPSGAPGNGGPGGTPGNGGGGRR